SIAVWKPVWSRLGRRPPANPSMSCDRRAVEVQPAQRGEPGAFAPGLLVGSTPAVNKANGGERAVVTWVDRLGRRRWRARDDRRGDGCRSDEGECSLHDLLLRSVASRWLAR